MGRATRAWSEGRCSELACGEVVSLVDIDHRLGGGSRGPLVGRVGTWGKLTQRDGHRGGRGLLRTQGCEFKAAPRPWNRRKASSRGDGSAATQQLAGPRRPREVSCRPRGVLWKNPLRRLFQLQEAAWFRAPFLHL